MEKEKLIKEKELVEENIKKIEIAFNQLVGQRILLEKLIKETENSKESK